MTGDMPPIPSANRSTKGPKPNADAGEILLPKRVTRKLLPNRAIPQRLDKGRMNSAAQYWKQEANQIAMTGDQSRELRVGDRVCWGATTTDLGTVIGTSWSGVTIAWDDGDSNSNMAQLGRVPTKIM
jgi:hypothetical protein